MARAHTCTHTCTRTHTPAQKCRSLHRCLEAPAFVGSRSRRVSASGGKEKRQRHFLLAQQKTRFCLEFTAVPHFVFCDRLLFFYQRRRDQWEQCRSGHTGTKLNWALQSRRIYKQGWQESMPHARNVNVFVVIFKEKKKNSKILHLFWFKRCSYKKGENNRFVIRFYGAF